MASSKLGNGIESVLRLQRPIEVVAQQGQLAGIIGPELVDVLAAREPIHRELANLAEGGGAKFIRRWGRFGGPDGHLPKTLRDSLELIIGPAAELAKELRSSHPKSKFDWNAPALFFESESQIFQRSNTLRKAWEGKPNALQVVQDAAKAQVNSTLAFSNGQVEITAQDAWGLACLLFMLDKSKGKLAICGNDQTCLARYFIAGRKNQQFCGNDECFAFAARSRMTKWWRESGNDWRAKRQKKKMATKGKK